MRALLTQYKRKSAFLNLVRFDSLMPKQKFMQQAEDEGFVYQGKNPTTLQSESVMIIHDDYTLGKLSGFITHMQYHTCPKEMCIDYARYINGLDDYYH